LLSQHKKLEIQFYDNELSWQQTVRERELLRKQLHASAAVEDAIMGKLTDCRSKAAALLPEVQYTDGDVGFK
jgi:hypothetical protein